jgi:hypothetical protein
MTPSIPTATWAARSRLGSSSPISRISPLPVTSRTPRTKPDRFVYRVPEPWVAVDTAPAICWVSMSPWLRSASPALQSGS